MKKLAIIFFVLALCACAKKPVVETPGDTVLADRWNQMLAVSKESSKAPWRMQMSLRFGDEGDTRRVTGIMWGNNDRKLRLDVMAGVGAIVAKILEDGPHFLVYATQVNKAYFHQGENKPLFKVGVPVPFDLPQLAELLNGNYAAVFGKTYDKASMLENGNASYELAAKEGAVLELDQNGLPVAWNEGGNGWRMNIGLDGNRPRRLALDRPNGKKAIILVKEREDDLPPFTAEQLNLAVPDGVPLLPLSQYKP